MANMSYCRFENTLKDLRDCIDHLWDEDLNEDEEKARAKLIKACQLVADQVDEEEEEEQ